MTMLVRRTIQALAGVLLLGGVTAAGDRSPALCTSAVQADTATWRRVGTDVFTLRLPRAYRGVWMRGIDTAVHGWKAPRGRTVHSDYGYVHYVGGGPFSDPELVCESGPRDAWRIFAYEDRGVYGVGYFGLDPSRDDRALTLEARSPRREDVPELLAIIRSMRWAGRPPLVGTQVSP